MNTTHLKANKYDVLFVARRLGDIVVYYHAGIAIRALDRRVTAILHFDPTFDAATQNQQPMTKEVFLNAISTGVWGFPEVLEGDRITEVFPPKDTVVHLKAPTSPDALEAIAKRIAEVLHDTKRGIKRRYVLPLHNCQHFAIEIATGEKSTSPDVQSATSAIADGLGVAFERAKAFTHSDTARTILECKPCSDNHFLGRVTNGIVRAGAIALAIIIVAVVFLVWFTFTTAGSYLRDVNKRHSHYPSACGKDDPGTPHKGPPGRVE
jgi:hypothetical protein